MDMTTTQIVLTVLGTAQVYSTIQQGKARSKAAKQQANLAEIDARSREIQRMKRMQAFIATSNVQGAAGNIDTSQGSFANQQIVAMRESKLGAATEKAQKVIKAKGYRDMAKYARRATITNAISSAASTYLIGSELGGGGLDVDVTPRGGGATPNRANV